MYELNPRFAGRQDADREAEHADMFMYMGLSFIPKAGQPLN